MAKVAVLVERLPVVEGRPSHATTRTGRETPTAPSFVAHDAGLFFFVARRSRFHQGSESATESTLALTTSGSTKTMPASYLIRFDDLCPTLNWKVWSGIEAVLLDREIKPLLAGIPDNQDEKLHYSPAHLSFWEEVRKWQARGWTIGLHGYQHRFVTQEPGMVGIQRRSEFAGVPPAEQEEKLLRAVEIFRSNGVRPEVWIAPAHSFDWNTVIALEKLGITTISD